MVYSTTFGENQAQYMSTITSKQLSALWWSADHLGTLKSLSQPCILLYTKVC